MFDFDLAETKKGAEHLDLFAGAETVSVCTFAGRSGRISAACGPDCAQSSYGDDILPMPVAVEDFDGPPGPGAAGRGNISQERLQRSLLMHVPEMIYRGVYSRGSIGA